MRAPFLGIFVNSIFAEHDGVQSVLDKLESVGANAVCTMPKLTTPDENGKRFPDLHWDGHERLLNRTLWGRRSLKVATTSSFRPRTELYAETSYLPPSGPSKSGPSTVSELLHQANRRGLETHLLIHPFLHADLDPDDTSIMVTGEKFGPPDIAPFACLNSENAVSYGLAYLQDVVTNYPFIDGLFLDWTEYGAYRLEDHFACVCQHCANTAHALGIDWESVNRSLEDNLAGFHRLSDDDLDQWIQVDDWSRGLQAAFMNQTGIDDLARLKAHAVSSFHERARQLLDDLDLAHIRLSARGWPSPWNEVSGMDYRALSASCDVAAPKLFTFDYAALPRWYGETLHRWNPDLSKDKILRSMLSLFGLDATDDRPLGSFRIPAPEETPAIDVEAFYRNRLESLVRQVSSETRFYPFGHAYVPDEVFERAIDVATQSGVDGLWIQMYGYLSDANFERLRVFSAGQS